MIKITAAEFNLDEQRYILVEGSQPNAPLCPFGNRFRFVGFDTKTKQYVRYTKSVFNKIKDKLNK